MPQLRFLEDATQHLSQQLGRQLELCRRLLDQEGSPGLSELHSSTQAIGEQLSQLVEFARQLQPVDAPELFSIVEALRLAQARVEPEAQERGITLSVQVHPSLDGLWLGEPERWQQILVNALRACVQNCQSQGLDVSVSTSRPEGDELVARLVFSGASLDSNSNSLALIALRHTVERLGGRIFTAGPVYAISVPVERPLRTAAQETVRPLELLAELQAEEDLTVLNGAVGFVEVELTTNPGLPEDPPAENLSPDSWYEEAAGLQASEPVAAPAPPAAILARCRRMLHDLASQEDWPRLEDAAAELLKVVPDCLQALQHLSLARVRQDDWNGAFPILRQLAMRYLETDNIEAAHALLKQMLASLPNPETGLNLAEDCLQQGEMGLAEAFFQAAADAWFAEGSLRQGLEALRRLQLLRPTDLALAQAVAGMLMRLGEQGEAVAVYRGMLRVVPSHRGALEGLALAAEVTGDEELAELVRRRLARPPSVRIKRP